MRFWLFLSLVASHLFAGPAARAQSSQIQATDAFLTAGNRFGVYVTQQILAAPPLPSMNRDQMSQLSVQAAYAGGKIRGSYPEGNDITKYQSDPQGYAAGLGYTSPSMGDLSYFGYVMYSSSQAELKQIVPGQTLIYGIRDNVINALAATAAFNLIILGSIETPVSVGIFAGGQAMQTKTKGEWAILNPGPSDAATGDQLSMDQFTFGPVGGMQIKIRFGKLMLIPYGLYFHDSSNHCTRMTYGSGASAEKTECDLEVDTSYGAAGMQFGWGRLRVTPYAYVWSRNDQSDSKSNVFKLSYAFEF